MSNSPKAAHQQKEDEDLESALRDMKGDEDLDEEEEKKEEALPNSAMMQLFSMPSYVNTDMSKVLPKDVLAKQGMRVMDNTKGSLCDLLKHHVAVAEECNDLETIAKEAEQAGNFGGLKHLMTQVEVMRAGLKDVVQKIRVRVKGRLVRPMMAESFIFEISDYDEARGEVKLRRLFDPNGILL